MTAYTSCGHLVSELPKITTIKEFSREGHPILKYMSLCPDCQEVYVSNDMVATSFEEQQKWLMQL